MQIETEHPVLFLFDSESSSTPEDTAHAFVTATNDCLCFWVLSSVDGASLVTVTDSDCREAGYKMFDGVLNAGSGKLILGDSRDFSYINIPVSPGPMPVEVWADDQKNPTWVWVKLGAIALA